jgi:hypothetical protein
MEERRGSDTTGAEDDRSTVLQRSIVAILELKRMEEREAIRQRGTDRCRDRSRERHMIDRPSLKDILSELKRMEEESAVGQGQTGAGIDLGRDT